MGSGRSLTAMMLLLVGSPALASPLWDKVEYGQSMDEMRHIYPPSSSVVYHDDYVVVGPITIAQGCPGFATIVLIKTTVKRVAVRGEPEAIQTCLHRIRSQLTSQYGKPKRKHGYLWHVGEVDITLNSGIPSPDELLDDVPLPLTHYWVVYFEQHNTK